MPFVIVALTLFAGLMAADADAATDAELLALAKKFSPVLILTEETGHKWGDIKVIKPEPVGIMGATSADNMWFKIGSSLVQLSDETWFNPNDVKSNEKTWDPGQNRIKLLENKFAFFNGLEDLTFTATVGSDNMNRGESYTLKDAHFDFSGTGTTGWNAEYERIGENFPNTAYVHIYQRTVEEYKDTYNPVTVIQYKYFYPYNDWWNDHEGDWQGIDVVVSSNDINTAQILGVEYRFHKAWLNYYKGDFAAEQTITNSVVFNPKTAVRVIPGPGSIENTHPVVYVGAGSHASYPVGGEIKIYHTLLELISSIIGGEQEVQGAVGGDYEYMTHTGLVLSTEANGTHSKLWERYDLQLLPEPYLDYDNNMGLVDTLSWLGAQIRWGTPGGIGGSDSPKNGPYNSASDCFSREPIPPDCGWGELKFFEVGKTGFGVSLTKYEMHHSDLPYNNYHHWAILGDETWSGTVNLLGDVVVFPGATLTIKPGTVVTFASQSDRHQFLSDTKGSSCLTELFVYGTLRSEGASGKRVVLRGPSGSTKPDDWGGIHTMTGGVVSLGDYTDVLNGTPPTEQPGTLTLSPNPPQALKQVTATLSDPNCIIEESVQWTYTYLSNDEEGATGSSSPTGATGTTSVKKKLGTPLPTDVGKRLRVTAHYRDGLGPGKSASIESAPIVAEDPPVLDGLLDLVLEEYINPDIIGPVDVGVYTNTDPNPNQPVWSLTGADADYFNLVQKASNDSNERTLQFKEPPNYEVPLAEGGYKTTYDIGVKVKDVPLSGAVGANGDALEDILLVTVTVTNVEEAGSVTLSPLPPKVGVALVAQLTDPDEGLTFTGASWAWERRADDTAAWESVSTGAAGATENYPELSSYKPKAADVGYHLRATVDYTDNEGPNKRAESEATSGVVGVPLAPALEAVAGDGQVALTWTAPSSDGGSPILRYQVRYYKADKSDSDRFPTARQY